MTRTERLRVVVRDLRRRLAAGRIELADALELAGAVVRGAIATRDMAVLRAAIACIDVVLAELDATVRAWRRPSATAQGVRS